MGVQLGYAGCVPTGVDAGPTATCTVFPHGGPVPVPSPHRLTPFCMTATGNVSIVALILANDSELLDINDSLGNTPLHAAAYAGGYETVALLLRVRMFARQGRSCVPCRKGLTFSFPDLRRTGRCAGQQARRSRADGALPGDSHGARGGGAAAYSRWALSSRRDLLAETGYGVNATSPLLLLPPLQSWVVCGAARWWWTHAAALVRT